jgi:hypothetical protein
MHIVNLTRWLIAGALASAAVATQSADVKADKRLEIRGIPNNLNCLPNTTDAFFMEAWGFNGSTRVCEAYTAGGTGTATCPANAGMHRSAVTTRNKTTFAFVSQVGPTSGQSSTWTGQSPMLNVVASGTGPDANGVVGPCTNSIFTGSLGFDVPVAPEPL